MTSPDEARKDCEICAKWSWLCDYHRGFINGYEAAQREREWASGTRKMGPAPPGMPRHFASETPQGRPGR